MATKKTASKPVVDTTPPPEVDAPSDSGLSQADKGTKAAIATKDNAKIEAQRTIIADMEAAESITHAEAADFDARLVSALS